MIEQLNGRVALVTGGTDGVGKEIARAMARRGARLIIVGRDAEKGARAQQEIRAFSGNKDVDFVQADLSLMRQTRRLGDEVAKGWPAMHYLVHSAGVVRGRHLVTAEGIESNFATNYLSRFMLTVRLLPALQAAGQPGKPARIVMVAHPGFEGTIHYDDVNLTTNFAMIRAFKQFHYANDVFAVELARRLTVSAQRPSVTILPSPRSDQNEYRQRNAAMDEADGASCDPSIDFSYAGCARCSGVEVVVGRGVRR